MTDADQGGEWVTGITGEDIHLDAQGNPIIEPPSAEPAEAPDPDAVRKAFDDVMEGLDAGDGTKGGGQAGWLDGVDATGILGGSGQIGGNDDETQKEIWREMDSGEIGGGAAGSLPPDVETLL
jgi:hypothetical protein